MAQLHGGQATSSSRDAQADPADALTNLLDHIAAELAEEYVRLMEAAAQEKNSGEARAK